MKVYKIVGGVLCLSLLVGTGALAGMEGSSAAGAMEKLEKQGEAKSPHSSAAKAVKGMDLQGGNTVTHNSLAAISIDKYEQNQDNMKALDGAPLPAEDLAQQKRKGGSRYFN